MENEDKKIDFNFNDHIVKEKIEPIPKLSVASLKKLKMTAFIILGGITIGVSLGVTNNLMKVYSIKEENKSHLAEIEAKNEELRKTKKFEFDLQTSMKQAEINTKNNQIKEAELESIILKKDQKKYEVWVENKKDIISNYESQLGIYDNAYQTSVIAVKNGLIGLDDLLEIRDLYQNYKRNIHSFITFINNTTSSFEVFHGLDVEKKDLLNGELIKYQNGDLNRSNDLENIFLKKLATAAYNKDSEKMAKIRKDTTNKIIDDLTDVVDNKNQTTKTKKIKIKM